MLNAVINVFMVALRKSMQCVKSVRIRSFSGPYFPAFGQNTDQKNSEYGYFSRSDGD